MAFTGSPTLKKITDKLYRLTGVALVADATGTIGFVENTSETPPEVLLSAPDWQPYTLDQPQNTTPPCTAGKVGLQDVVRVTFNNDTDVSAAVPISVVKTGTTHADFQIALHNDNALEGQISGELEIYIELAGH